MLRCFAFAILMLTGFTGCLPQPAEPAANSSSESSSSTEANQETSANVSPEGTWVVQEFLFYTEPDPERVGHKLTIHGDGTGQWERYGRTETIEFKLAEPDDSGAMALQVATNEDHPAMGGGGPRTGLVRILDSGEMEIIESTAALDPVPADFGDATKKDNIYYRLAR